MKFSKSLLKDKDISKKIFDSSIDKAKTLLTSIFGLDFSTDTDSNIKEVLRMDQEFKFSVIFNLKGRNIKAKLQYEHNGEDIIEVLKISEVNDEQIFLIDIPSDFNKAIDRVMNYLEKKYEIDFTPLDLEERDVNIKEIIKSDNIFKVLFTHDYHEALFEATYKRNDSFVRIVKNNQHSIYLD